MDASVARITQLSIVKNHRNAGVLGRICMSQRRGYVFCFLLVLILRRDLFVFGVVGESTRIMQRPRELLLESRVPTRRAKEDPRSFVFLFSLRDNHTSTTISWQWLSIYVSVITGLPMYPRTMATNQIIARRGAEKSQLEYNISNYWCLIIPPPIN